MARPFRIAARLSFRRSWTRETRSQTYARAHSDTFGFVYLRNRTAGSFTGGSGGGGGGGGGGDGGDT